MPNGQPSLFDNTYASEWLDFREARAFVRELHISSLEEWLACCKGERPLAPPLPDNIPTDPDKVYRHLGWSSWEDWLGITLEVQVGEKRSLWNTGGRNPWLEFQEARAFVHELGLEYQEAWAEDGAPVEGLLLWEPF